eukprot:544293_1
MVLSTALFNKPAFKNIIVNGTVLAEDGTQMSKSKKNYPLVDKIFDKYGADALLICLTSSPVVRAEKLKFSALAVASVVSTVLVPWYNVYKFFIENVSRDTYKMVINIMDKWILSELQSLIKFFVNEMESYRLYNVAPKLLTFIDLLCNTYVRMNRQRIRG